MDADLLHDLQRLIDDAPMETAGIALAARDLIAELERENFQLKDRLEKPCPGCGL